MAGEKIVDLLTELMPGVPKTCIDYSSHFPAGDKRRIPGIGLKSQIAAAGSGGYGPYNPTEPGFVFRSGVCGASIVLRTSLTSLPRPYIYKEAS